MKHFEKLYLKTQTLSLFKEILSDSAVSALLKMVRLPPITELAAAWSDYYFSLAVSGCTRATKAYFNRLILKSGNVFSFRTTQGQDTGDIDAEVKRELEVIRELSEICPADFVDAYGEAVNEFAVFTAGKENAVNIDVLRESVLKKGYGEVYEKTAFVWNSENKRLEPVESVNPVRLSDLKEYGDCKKAVIDNTLSFIKGLPANNVLLYGDRGTGKSSTVHAVLNEYENGGLRLVEVRKSQIREFSLIMNSLKRFTQLKFIIFIDDLTFIEGADDYAQLKAALEGSVLKLKNILIYATTNRRHLLKESHTDRTGDLHEQDTIQEQLSLSDRFGLVVTYINPDKKEFLNILMQILACRKIKLDEDTAGVLAERYALKKGGRSPRAAKQLADMIESRYKRGENLEDMY